MDYAGARQEQRGGHDQGARANVTSGRDLDKVAEVIADDLVASTQRIIRHLLLSRVKTIV